MDVEYIFDLMSRPTKIETWKIDWIHKTTAQNVHISIKFPQHRVIAQCCRHKKILLRLRLCTWCMSKWMRTINGVVIEKDWLSWVRDRNVQFAYGELVSVLEIIRIVVSLMDRAHFFLLSSFSFCLNMPLFTGSVLSTTWRWQDLQANCLFIYFTLCVHIICCCCCSSLLIFSYVSMPFTQTHPHTHLQQNRNKL